MSIQGEIDRLSAAKTAIASALETMGIEPPEGTTLDQYAAQLTAIAASAPWLDKSTYDPQNKAQDVFGYVDSVAEGLIEYVDFTVTEEPLNGGYRTISNKTFDEVVALLKAGKTVIGRVVQKRGDSFYYLTLTIGQAIDMGEGQLQNICFSSYFDDSIKSNSTTIIMDETFSIYKGYSALHIPEPDDTEDNGKVLMASNSEGVWSPMPTAGELGALPLAGGTMTGPLTLSGDPTEDLQAAPKQYVDGLMQGWSVNDKQIDFSAGNSSSDVSSRLSLDPLGEYLELSCFSRDESGNGYGLNLKSSYGVWPNSKRGAQLSAYKATSGGGMTSLDITLKPDEGTISFECSAIQTNAPIELPGNPEGALQAVPKQYVDMRLEEALNGVYGDMEYLIPRTITITLPASGWSNNQQTVTATGVTADNAVTPSPAPVSWEAAGAAGVRCTAQGADSLTFTCSETPTEDLTYNVLIQEVQ